MFVYVKKNKNKKNKKTTRTTTTKQTKKHKKTEQNPAIFHPSLNVDVVIFSPPRLTAINLKKKKKVQHVGKKKSILVTNIPI